MFLIHSCIVGHIEMCSLYGPLCVALPGFIHVSNLFPLHYFFLIPRLFIFKAQCQSVLHKQTVQHYSAVMPASHSACLCITPSWAHLCVCRDDWVSFNRLDHENTCWTSQGRCITCWKGVLGFGSVHKYTCTDVWHIRMHMYIHTRRVLLLCCYLVIEVPFFCCLNFSWTDFSLFFNQWFFQLAAHLLMAVGMAFKSWQER